MSDWSDRKYPGIDPSEVDRILRLEDEDRPEGW